ncbi:LOW QUALITY PROTEIN: hypothetical protein HID58_033974, partial [Brassica napus]
GKLVRLWRGVWNKENNGAGNFHLDPTYFGFGEITRDKETFEPLMSIDEVRVGRTDSGCSILAGSGMDPWPTWNMISTDKHNMTYLS